MIEMAVKKGVKVVIFTTHSDCAAEKVAASPTDRKIFPSLAKAMDDRKIHIASLQERPLIAERLAKKTLKIEFLKVDTETGKFVKN
ncbi:MAG: hypothetical protein IT569_06735 [Leptospiraceae bacterium]|nr:hypothetical protein [Leptospiraceae bacterium]